MELVPVVVTRTPGQEKDMDRRKHGIELVACAGHRDCRCFDNSKPDGYDGGRCSCGSAWFQLADGLERGLFTVDNSGMVTGFSGQAVCAECATPWTPPRTRFSVV